MYIFFSAFGKAYNLKISLVVYGQKVIFNLGIPLMRLLLPTLVLCSSADCVVQYSLV